MKQRIVGALVLISLAVIIVPVVMDLHKDRGRREAPIGIPPKPKDYSVQVLPLVHPDKPAAEQAPPAQKPAPAKAPDGDQPKGTRVEEPPPPETTASVGAPPAPEQGANTGEAQAWDVQVGSFSSRDNARTLRDKLRSRHYTAYVEKVVLDSGHDRYRVRVGPELLHADAEKLQRRLEKEQKLHGIVVSH